MFCEDVAASGGYFLALAGDEIYADPSSIVGSIGVISAGFGLDKLIDRFGIERRVHASGKDKGALDPFQPERPRGRGAAEGPAARTCTTSSSASSRSGAPASSRGPEEEMFSGSYWSAASAVEYGLIDGIADLRSKMQALHGTKVRLRAVPLAAGGLLSRFRRLPGLSSGRERRSCVHPVVGR